MGISCAVSCRATEHGKMSRGSGPYLSDSSCKRSNDLLLEGFVTLTSAKPQAFLRQWYRIIDSILPLNSLLRFCILPGVELLFSLCFPLSTLPPYFFRILYLKLLRAVHTTHRAIHSVRIFQMHSLYRRNSLGFPR